MKARDAVEWMPFHGDAFFGSERVALMEPAAQMLYLRCIWRQWVHGSIPSDEKMLRKLFPEYAENWAELWPQVACMFDEVNGRLVNETCAKRRTEAEIAVEKARKGAESVNAKRQQDAAKEAAKAEQRANKAQAKRERDASDSLAQRERLASATRAQRERALETETVRERETGTILSPHTPPPGGLGACAPGSETAVVPGTSDAERDPDSEADPQPERKRRKGGGTPATRLWDALWVEQRAVPFAWSEAEAVQLAACVKLADGDLEELERRIRAMLESDDLWLVQNATPKLLRSKWNALAVRVEARPKKSQAQLNVEEILRQGAELEAKEAQS